MDAAKEKKASIDWLRQLALVAGLDLDDESLELLAPQVERYFVGIQRLTRLDLGETEPPAIFAREED